MKSVRGSRIVFIPKVVVLILIGIMILLCILYSSNNNNNNNNVFFVNGATEVKWTPNPDDNTTKEGSGKAGPLPLSSKQRQQLVQLDNVIRSSPDPTATLQKAAEANEMSPQDLLALLERNRSDLQQSGVGGGASIRKPPITAFLSTIISIIVTHTTQIIKKYPRIITLLVASILVSIYGTIEKNRTGLFLSHKAIPLLSNGPTTFFIPPTSFLQQQIQLLANTDSRNNDDNDNDNNVQFTSSINNEIVENYLNSILDDTKDDDSIDTSTKNNNINIQWYDNVIPGIRTAVSTSSIIDVTEFKNDDDDQDDDDDDNDNDNEQSLLSSDEIITTILDTADMILHDSHDITEFVSLTGSSTAKDTTTGSSILPTRFMKFVPATRGLSRQSQISFLVVQGLGDYNRYGLVPIRIIKEQLLDDNTNTDDADEDEDKEVGDNEKENEQTNNNNNVQQTSITLQSLPSSHFEGYIHISIETARNDKGNKKNKTGSPNSIRIQVHLIIPEGCKKIKSKILASDIVQGINYSIQRSIRQHTKIRLVRKYQSLLYMQHASMKASKKRNSRSSKERAIEEMAVDRRRRWQRNNPNSGYYRPSGDRMKSPNNAIVFK